MRKLFQQIDELCKHATMHGICTGLKLEWFGGPNAICIKLNGREHTLPGATDHRWRRQWKSFLTDHADEIATNLDAAAAAAPAVQSGSAS